MRGSLIFLLFLGACVIFPLETGSNAGMGTDFADIDNDGNPLFLATSHVMDNIEVTQPHLSYRQKPLLLKNAGNMFVNVSSSSGAIFDEAWASRGAAFGDLDNDGDIDVVISTCNGPAHVLRNDGGNRSHWTAVELQGTKSNRMGIGAKVTLTTARGQVQYNMASTAASYLSANDRRVFFGTGKEESIQEIRILWPSGIEQVIASPRLDQFLKVREQSCPCPPGAAPPLKMNDFPFEGDPGGCPCVNWTAPSNKTPPAAQGHEALSILHPPSMGDFQKGFPTDGSAVPRAPDKPSKASPPAKPSDAEQPPVQGVPAPSTSQLSSGSLDSSSSARKAKVSPAAVVKYRLAESLLQQGKAAEAAEALKAAIQLQPDFIEAHFALGVILARQGRENYGAAIDHFLAVLRLDPRHVDARINLSNLLEQEGDFEAAASALKEALSLADGRADLYVMLGQKQRNAEKYSEAIQSFHRALELDPQISGAHYGLAMTLRSLGDLAAAQSEFELALKSNPDDAYAHYQLGRFLIQQKEPVEAAHHLEESIRLKPELADAYAKLGVLYRSLKKNDEAEKAFRTAIRMNPKLEKACYGLAQVLQAKGQVAEADLFFEQVRQLKASSGTLAEASNLNATGVVLMNAGKLDESLEKFRAALALDPAHAAAAYNQGLVLARQGKTAEAIESFKTAIRLRPGFVLAHYGLGLALRLAGDPLAEEQLRKAQLMKRLVPQVGTLNRNMRPEDPD